MEGEDGLIATLAAQHGLARTPLFRHELDRPGRHDLLLDGNFGSFAVSESDEIEPEAPSWAWSSYVPHHVLVRRGEVRVLRWDAPADVRSFPLARVLDEPRKFYEHLRTDRTKDRRDIVSHAMDLFQRVRSLIHDSKIEDERTISAYLFILGALASGQDRPAEMGSDFSLPSGTGEVVGALRAGAVPALIEQFGALDVERAHLKAFPSLALRHASGPIFQEAHRRLVEGGSPDMLGHVAPARSSRQTRSVVHFTPPYLARALCEQAIDALGDLGGRASLVVSDVACGSGAFLVEALRTLERKGFSGRVTLVGRDSSGVAVTMARFVLDLAAREWPGVGRCDLDIAPGDSLKDASLPLADVVVMNPPFKQWQAQTAEERSLSKTILGKAAFGRPDLSMSFVTRALDRLAPKGSLAALLPASALSGEGSSRWRETLVDGRSACLAATFDDQSLFRPARVKIGAVVLSGTCRTGLPLLLHAGTGKEDTGEALRALRGRLVEGMRDGDGTRFSICRAVIPPGRSAWTVMALGPRPLAARCREAGIPVVGELFKVSQGIRSGDNDVFVLDDLELARLPKSERDLFRKAADGDHIADGRLVGHYHVFYPHDGDTRIADEDQLKSLVPTYYERFLKPAQEALAHRRGRAERWWELSERRPGLAPMFVSKYFGARGSFVMPGADVVVLQGFGWSPKSHLQEALLRGAIGADLTAAYLAIFNSTTFVSLLTEQGSKAGGGQQDMSERHVEKTPLVDLTAHVPGGHAPVRALACYARHRYLGCDAWSPIDDEEAERMVGWLFGLEASAPSRGERLPERAPVWLRGLVEGGLVGTAREERLRVSIKMDEIAATGAYDELEAALAYAPVRDLADTSMMTLLRGTYRYRDRLGGWKAFRDRVAEELGTRGAPVGKLLVGLYA